MPGRPHQLLDAISVDPDETARNEPSHKDLHCLLFDSRFLISILICDNGYVQIQMMEESIAETHAVMKEFM